MDKIIEMLTSQHVSITMIRQFGNVMLEHLHKSSELDSFSLDMLKMLNSKEYNMLDTYFKISSLLLKTFPMEQKVAGIIDQKTDNHTPTVDTNDHNILKTTGERNEKTN